MKCECCPAYWEDITPMVGVEEWGCYCEPENGNDCGYEVVEGFYGCNRTIDDIKSQLNYMLASAMLNDYMGLQAALWLHQQVHDSLHYKS